MIIASLAHSLSRDDKEMLSTQQQDEPRSGDIGQEQRRNVCKPNVWHSIILQNLENSFGIDLGGTEADSIVISRVSYLSEGWILSKLIPETRVAPHHDSRPLTR